MAKAFSERNNISPEKTSHFGFFDESSTLKNIGKTVSVKRQFESRDEPKR